MSTNTDALNADSPDTDSVNEASASNPLLQTEELPRFSAIRPEHVEPAITQILEDNLARIGMLLEQTEKPSWDNLVAVMEELEDRLRKSWSPVSHLNSVRDSEALRQAYNACLPKISDYSSRLGQNSQLFQAYRQVLEQDGARLDPAQRQELENEVLDFRLSGVDLPEEEKRRFAEISKRLSALGSKFGENVLDATMAWFRQVEDEAELSGLPESALAQARQTAEERGLEGHVFTLDVPSYLPVMLYADHRDLRREMYEAYVTRASDVGPTAGEWDNREIIEEILALRQEQASLLDYANYAELSLARKMAGSTGQVMDFLRDLAERTAPVARREFAELSDFARQELGLDKLEAWDVPYASEKLRQRAFDLSQEELRPWFPVNRVIEGMFSIVNRLYGVEFRENPAVETWHRDAVYYDVIREGEVVAGFFVDLYARDHKKGGAWMDECRVRRRLPDGSLQRPVAYLVCNFTPPMDGRPALLTHSEVTTLFHEFGHGLHHVLTRVDWPGVSGINGVAWDAVELPSQLLENWCWEPETLPLISGHFESGEPLPAEKLDKLLAARNFQAGMQMMRQLEFALFDFRLHMEYDGEEGQVARILDEVRQQVALYPVPAWNRFQNGFSHIFAGGYAAGYYSYKWAEVLSADVFGKFREQGVLSREAGEEFLDKLLSRGGSKPAMDLFRAYRGREPEVDHLLRASGITGD